MNPEIEAYIKKYEKLAAMKLNMLTEVLKRDYELKAFWDAPNQRWVLTNGVNRRRHFGKRNYVSPIPHKN